VACITCRGASPRLGNWGATPQIDNRGPLIYNSEVIPRYLRILLFVRKTSSSPKKKPQQILVICAFGGHLTHAEGLRGHYLSHCVCVCNALVTSRDMLVAPLNNSSRLTLHPVCYCTRDQYWASQVNSSDTGCVIQKARNMTQSTVVNIRTTCFNIKTGHFAHSVFMCFGLFSQ
jgi:hypothetical protein